MSLIQLVSSKRIGREPDCTFCDAGRTVSFNWEQAKTTTRPDARRDLTVFVDAKPLRCGTLYHCKYCGQPWYLYGEPVFMNFVPRQRLPLIQQWNERPILLSREQILKLQKIGRTPPDIYGNGAQFHEIPCAVSTIRGEQIEIAVISFQSHAPFEEWRNYRLATEIAEIRCSAYALPLPVRTATSQANEVRMGFAPTLVELPDGELIALNWTQHFFVKEGCDSSKVVLCDRISDRKNLPLVCNGPERVVLFVADKANIPDE